MLHKVQFRVTSKIIVIQSAKEILVREYSRMDSKQQISKQVNSNMKLVHSNQNNAQSFAGRI